MAELLESPSDQPPDDVPPARVAAMKRAFDALADVAIAAAFVAFVEFYCRRRGRPDRLLRGLGKDHAGLPPLAA